MSDVLIATSTWKSSAIDEILESMLVLGKLEAWRQLDWDDRRGLGGLELVHGNAGRTIKAWWLKGFPWTLLGMGEIGEWGGWMESGTLDLKRAGRNATQWNWKYSFTRLENKTARGLLLISTFHHVKILTPKVDPWMILHHNPACLSRKQRKMAEWLVVWILDLWLISGLRWKSEDIDSIHTRAARSLSGV